MAYTTPARINGLPPIRLISAGEWHNAAIGTDGSVWTWGLNQNVQLGDGTEIDRSVPVRINGLPEIATIHAGGFQTVAHARDGSVWAWGFGGTGALGNGTGESQDPALQPLWQNIRAIAVSRYHTMGLKSDGTVVASGANYSGQIGDGTDVDRLAPTPVQGLTGVVAIAAGENHSIALKSDGSVWAWGDNANRQLGDGTTVERRLPVRVQGLPVITAIWADYLGNFAQAADGSIWAWGTNANGEFGNGDNQSQNLPVRVANWVGMQVVLPSTDFSLGLTQDGRAFTAGRNTNGQLGDGTRVGRTSPGVVPGLTGLTQVSAGRLHSLALKSDGSVWAWGHNSYGQLGNGFNTTRTTPRIVAGVDGAVAVAAGYLHTLALKSDGTVWAWGFNYSGHLGNGTTLDSSTPVQVTGLTRVTAIAAGGDHSYALLSDGTVWAWGANVRGELGDGTHSIALVPRQIPGLSGIRAITSGGYFGLALRADGTVMAWGENELGQLGDGTRIDRLSPQPIPGLAGVVELGAGDTHAIARHADGSVSTWGGNRFGQLGDGTRVDQLRPQRVAGIANAVGVFAGGFHLGDSHSFAALASGEVLAWGRNRFAALGFPQPNVAILTPTLVPGLKGAASIATHNWHSIALHPDGTMRGWGRNTDGRVGDGTLARRTTPVVVVEVDGAGSIGGDNWYLDLDGARPNAIPAELVPVFDAVATGDLSIGVSAMLRPRSQDAGSTSGVYVFAVAPADIVRPAAAKGQPLVLGKAKSADGKATDVACVLAQLNGAGQLQAVSASSLQAFVTGVLSSQGQAVTVINGAASVNIGGATFYVGYGPSSSSMLNGGLNRSVVTVPGGRECRPEAPQTGWWWNKSEGGRGYSIEVQGNKIFYAAFLYDDAGRSNWYVATGITSLDGSLFTGDLLRVANGQSLGGAYRAPSAAQGVGPFTLAFSDAKNGTMVWPGGTVAIERFDIVPNGLNAAPRTNQPESGWWWNPAESGRGFFIEWQDGVADLAGYMYDDAGNPVWYLSVQQTPNIQAFSGSWWLYANGQSLTGAYRPATQINNNVAPVSINFTSATTATMTLPNGRTTALQRHRF